MTANTHDAGRNKTTHPDYSVVILAGGFSRRFGRDKANAPWEGRKMINQVANRLRVLGCGLIAAARAEQDTAGWEADRIVHDDPTLPDCPLRGIVQGLEACDTPWSFVVGCDAPLLQPALLLGLRASATPECLAVVPHWGGRLQPLMALYRTAGAAPLRTLLENGERSPARALQGLPHVLLVESVCRRYDRHGTSFLNVNYPQDPAMTGVSALNNNEAYSGSEPCHRLI